MAAPAPRPETFGALLGDPSLWESPDAAYQPLIAIVGDSASDRNAVAAGLLSIAARTPVAVATVLSDTPDCIQVLHTPTRYASDLANPHAALDGRIVMITGNDATAAVPVVLPSDSFGCTAVAACYQTGYIRSVAGHGNPNGAVFQFPPTGSGAAGTSDHRARRAMLMPPALSSNAVTTSPLGNYTFVSFYELFIAPGLADADLTKQADAAILEIWWRAASMLTNAGAPLVSIIPNPVRGVAANMALTAWTQRSRTAAMARLGHGGPGLTNASFANGMDGLRTTMNNNHQARIAHEAAALDKSFTDKFGPSLALRLHRMCGVADDADLPEAHQLLVKTTKAREYATLQALFDDRAHASIVPLTVGSAPLATTQLVDEVFRRYTPGNQGLTFAKGLTPFSIVCEGHQEAHDVHNRVVQAAAVESSASLTLADAAVLATRDSRFPSSPYVAVEKLYGFSVVVDVFHGVAHPYAVVLRAAVVQIGPCLHRLVEQAAENIATGMDLVCRVLYDIQQDYFLYVSGIANGQTPDVPCFQDIINKVNTFRVDGLCHLPTLWYAMISAPKDPRRATGRGTAGVSDGGGASLRQQAGTVVIRNPRPDSRLVNRFANSGHSSITAMLGDHGADIPKVGDKPVCLSWALKGECSDACKRKTQHKVYNRATAQALHLMMDACGVANPNP